MKGRKSSSSATGLAVAEAPEYKFFNTELTLSTVSPFGEFVPQLSTEASESTTYLHDLSEACGGSCYRPLVTGKPGFANVPAGTVFGEEQRCKPHVEGVGGSECGPHFEGATEDLGHIVVRVRAALTPGAAPYNGLYEWAAGVLAPVSVLPDGESAGGAFLGLSASNAGGQAARRAISTDGARIDWEFNNALYQRDMSLGRTVQLDVAEAGCLIAPGAEKCESGGGAFQIASADGSRVFFTDFNRLTKDSGAKHNESDLYECNVVAIVPGEESCSHHLTDLTPANGGESADVLGGTKGGAVLGAGEDGANIYFVAKGIQSETQNGRGEKAQVGKPNLYVRRGASTEFIMTLAGAGETEEGDAHDWEEILREQPTRVSGNGRWLEFMSQASPTGYDNRDRATGRTVAEVYLYDAETKRLVCASCLPTGVRPTGVEAVKLEAGSGGLTIGRGIWPQHELVAANVPGWTTMQVSVPSDRYQPRYLNNEGRLLFDTADPLVPQDSNNTQDVYQHEPAGVGDCSESSVTYSAVSEGCVSLISSGRSAQESAFLDASESGNDVFFLTSAKLSPLDVDASRDVYDAHVCSTGSPCITYPNTQSPPCTNEASCKASPTPQPSIFGAPSSATFAGMGNPKPAVVVKAKTAAQLRAEKLKKALKSCHAKKNKHKRQGCEKAARKKYAAPKPRAKQKSKT